MKLFYARATNYVYLSQTPSKFNTLMREIRGNDIVSISDVTLRLYLLSTFKLYIAVALVEPSPNPKRTNVEKISNTRLGWEGGR